MNNAKTEVILSEVSDWHLFNLIADSIAEKFNAKWIEKVDGLDQRYWDFDVEDVKLTLHLEHYLGISLFSANSDCKTKCLVESIREYLEKRLS